MKVREKVSRKIKINLFLILLIDGGELYRMISVPADINEPATYLLR
jgi:hypothetical protein